MISASTPLTPEDKIITALLHAKTKLVNARNSMNGCQDEMKAMFDRHRDTLDNDQMMIFLRSLSNDMTKIWEGAKAGMDDADKAIDWMKMQARGEDNLIDI